MEILTEIAGWMLQVIGELLLQFIGEVLVEWLGHSVKERFRRPRPAHPVLAAIGYLTFGAAVGALSVWLVPTLYIKTPWLRIANLALTPLAVGLLMDAIGSWRAQREKEVLRLETFVYGFCFAIAMAVVRFAFGH